jgi:hypothetical protein
MELEEQIMGAIKTPMGIMVQTEPIRIQKEQILIQMGLEEQITGAIKTPMGTILVVMEILMGIMAMVTTLMA